MQKRKIGILFATYTDPAVLQLRWCRRNFCRNWNFIIIIFTSSILPQIVQQVVALWHIDVCTMISIIVTSHERYGVSNQSPTTWLLVQQPAHANKANIKAQHYWLFVKGMYRWPVVFFHKAPGTRKIFTSLYNIIQLGHAISRTKQVNAKSFLHFKNSILSTSFAKHLILIIFTNTYRVRRTLSATKVLFTGCWHRRSFNTCVRVCAGCLHH